MFDFSWGNGFNISATGFLDYIQFMTNLYKTYLVKLNLIFTFRIQQFTYKRENPVHYLKERKAY